MPDPEEPLAGSQDSFEAGWEYNEGTVEAWAVHGISPPPLSGDPNDPDSVAFVKRARALHVRLEAEGTLKEPPTDAEVKAALAMISDPTFGEFLKLWEGTGIGVAYTEDGKRGSNLDGRDDQSLD